MRIKIFGTALALAGGLFFIVNAEPAEAQTITSVTCFTPVTNISTGQGGSFDQPRWELHCLGGSTATNISHFSWRISENVYLAPLMEKMFGDLIRSGRPPPSLIVRTDLSDVSGNAWGCGSSNCRIIAGFEGQ